MSINVIEIFNHLRLINDAVAREVHGATEETAKAIVADVQGGPHAAPIETGRLRSSYSYTMKGPLAAEVGSGPSIAPYAIFVELGHHSRGGTWVPAQPHLIPAAEAQRPEFDRRIVEAVDRAIK